MTYTSEQNLEMTEAKIRLRRTGHPSAVQRIDLAISQDLPFSKIQAFYKPQKVKPENPAVPVKATYNHPPLNGKGSGRTPWREFAKTVSDMDPEIIDSMERSDIITVMRDRGIIS